jgi:Fe-S cluster biogenesis protein NfuA
MPDSTVLHDQIISALDGIRPYLQVDGGDVELLEVQNGSDVILKLTGACSNCHMSDMTMTAGIEETLRRSIPGLGKIIAVKE